ncbi:MAG: DUF6428 family protein [Chthoniobacterales bacterium]
MLAGVMKLNELKSLLRSHPSSFPRFVLPDGDQIPAHFHITEVGHITKRFIDCGGTLHDRSETCLLQTWFSDNDPDHRLNAVIFAKILDLGRQVLPHDDLEVEVEYDDCGVSQFPIENATLIGDHLELRLSKKKTDCLAKEKCGADGCGTSNKPETHAAAGCC